MSAPALAPLTVADAGFLARARVLARSWAEHHDGQPVTVVVAGELPAVDEPAWRLVPADTVMPRGELRRLRGRWPTQYIGWALKPWALLHMLEQPGVEAALFVDADTRVFAPLDDLGPIIREHGLMLTPHLLQPSSVDAELSVLNAGAWNSGLVGVGQEAIDAVRWWAQRCAAVNGFAPEAGIFSDQRWLDILNARRPATVLRDPGINVLWTRLLHDDVVEGPTGLTVAGHPLRLFHFSGAFDPDDADRLGSWSGRFDVDLAARPAVTALYREYARDLLAAGHRELSAGTDAFLRMADGTLVDGAMRALFDEALHHAQTRGTREPPGPFDDDGGAAFRAWLRSPSDLRRYAIKHSRYALALRARSPELPAATPNPADDRDGALAAAIAAHRADAPAALLRSGREVIRPPDEPNLLRPGVTLLVDAHPTLAGWALAAWAPRVMARTRLRVDVLRWDSRESERASNDGRALAAAGRRSLVVAVCEPDRVGALNHDLLAWLEGPRRRALWCAVHGASDLFDAVWTLSEVPVPAVPPARAEPLGLPSGATAVVAADLAADGAREAIDDALAVWAACRPLAAHLCVLVVGTGGLGRVARAMRRTVRAVERAVYAPQPSIAAVASAVLRASAVLASPAQFGGPAEWASAAGIPAIDPLAPDATARLAAALGANGRARAAALPIDAAVEQSAATVRTALDRLC